MFMKVKKILKLNQTNIMTLKKWKIKITPSKLNHAKFLMSLVASDISDLRFGLCNHPYHAF